MADILIEGATVVTLDEQRRVLDDAAVAIEGNRIVAVGPTDELRRDHPAERVIDGRRKIVLPGLVDLYAHSGGALLKCIGEHLDGAGMRDLYDDVAFRFATERFWYVDSQLHALERLRFGCTMLLSQPGVSTPRLDDPRYTLATQRAFEDLGVRARIVIGPARPPWPKTFVEYVNGRTVERQVTFEQILDNCDRILAGWQAHPSPLVDYSTGTSRFGNQNPMDPMWRPEHDKYARLQADGLRALMDRYDVGYWCHAYGNAIEFAYDQNLGLLGPKSILSHVSGISERTIRILAETDTRVGHHPRARRLYQFQEPCPVVELLEAGVTVGLGSDGPQPDRPADPFQDMKMAMYLQRHRFGTERVLPPGKALEMATLDGFHALGLDAELGSIEVGKKADLIVVEAFNAHLWPLSMPVQQLVYFASGADVQHVIVDGRLVVEHGRATAIDEAALLEEAAAELERLMREPALGLRRLTDMPEGFWGQARY